MRWLLPIFALALMGCPPDLCDRACVKIVEECGDEERSYNECANECIQDGTWAVGYVECVEAAANCNQLSTCG